MADTYVSFKPTIEIHGDPNRVINALIKIKFCMINSFPSTQTFYYKRGEVEIRIQLHVNDQNRDGNATIVAIPNSGHDIELLKALCSEITSAIE